MVKAETPKEAQVPSDNHVEQPPTRASWYGDDPGTFATLPDCTGSPYVVNGRNPANDPDRSAEERLDWLRKQHEADRKA